MNFGISMRSTQAAKEKADPTTDKVEMNLENLSNPDSREESDTSKLMKESMPGTIFVKSPSMTPEADSLKIEQLEKAIEACRRVEAYMDEEVETQRVEKRELQQHLLVALNKVAKLTEEQDQQRDQIMNVSDELDQTNAELRRSSNVVNELRGKVEDQADVLRSGRLIITRLEEAIENQQNQQETSEMKLEDISNKIRQMEDEKSNLIDENRLRQDRNLALKQELDDTRGDIKKLNATVDDKDLTILALEERENSLKQQVDNVLQANEAHENSSNNLMRVNKEIGIMEADRDKLKEEAEVLRGRNNLLQDDLGDTQNNIKNLQVVFNEKNDYIKKLDTDKNELKQRLDMLKLEIEVIEENTRGKRSAFMSKLAKKDEEIMKLQKELAKTKRKLVNKEEDSLTHELNELTIDDLSTRKEFAEMNQTNLSLEKENVDLDACTPEVLIKDNTDQVNDLKGNEYKTSPGKVVEKSLEEYSANGLDNNNDVQFDIPQALYLQAAIDRKKSTTTTSRTNNGSNWKIGSSCGSRKSSKSDDSGSSSNNDEQVQQLADKNAKLENLIAQLRSDLVMQKTSHREELYIKQRIIRELQCENDAYMAKNEVLAKNICDNHSVAIVRAV